MGRGHIQLPPDGGGKAALAFTETEAGTPAPNAGVRYVQAFVQTDVDGQPLALATQATTDALLTELAQKVEPAHLAGLATTAKQDVAQASLDLLATESSLQALSAQLPTALVGGRLDVRLGASGVTVTTDPSDRVGRLLGHVTVDNLPVTQPVSLAVNTPDVTDRVGRLLGHVTVDNPTDVSTLATAARQDAQTTHLTTLAGVDYATGADIDTLATKLDSVITNTADIALDADHLSITADTINLSTDGIEGRLDTLNTKDFATETTLAALKARGDLLATEATLAAASAKLPAALVGGRLDVNLGASSVTVPVSGTFWQATQPVSAAALPLPAGAALETTQQSVLTALQGTLTVDTELPAAAALGDAMANPTVPGVGAFGMGWTGSVWRRLVTDSNGFLRTTPSAGVTNFADATTLSAATAVGNWVFNGTNWDRLRSYTGIIGTTSTTGLQPVAPAMWIGAAGWGIPWASSATGDAGDGSRLPSAGQHLFNGTTWDRLRSAPSAATALIASGTSAGIPMAVGVLSQSNGNYRSLYTASSIADADTGSQYPANGNMVYNGATWDRMRSFASDAGATGVLMAGLALWDGSNAVRVNTASAISDGSTVTRVPPVSNLAYNGTTWDRTRNNTAAIALGSATRTATNASGNFQNYNGAGVRVYLNVTAASGAGGLQLRIRAADSISGGNFALNTLPTAITATGLYVFDCYPGATGGAVTQATSLPVGRNWNVQVIHGDASSYTYSVSYETITT